MISDPVPSDRPLVYFVDDEPDILDVFEIFFAHRFDIALFSHPEEAIAAAALTIKNGRPPDAIVTDFRMPKVTGIDLISRIRESDSNIRAILLSGNLDKDIAIKAANKGIFRILEKPFDGSEVEKALDELLSERRAEFIRTAIQAKILHLKEMYVAMRLLMTTKVPEFDEILRENLFDPTDPLYSSSFEEMLEELEGSLEELMNNESFNTIIRKKAA